MTALQLKIKRLFDIVYSDSPREDKGTLNVECEMLIKKLLLMVDQTKKNLKMSGWLHMPPTSVFRSLYERELTGNFGPNSIASNQPARPFDESRN